MAKMTAAAAAVGVLEREGVRVAFGVPGAAIAPTMASTSRVDRMRFTAGRLSAGPAGGP